MRYPDVVRQYLAVSEASSREWRVSDTLVMCVELDMSMDTYMTVAVAQNSSQRRRGPQLMRVTFFRAYEGSDGPAMVGCLDTPEALAGGFPLEHEERVVIDQHRGNLADWVSGKRDRLPPSTSTVIADRLRRTR